MKRGARRPSGTPINTSGGSDHAGFNAKTLKNASNYDADGERKMRLNNKPIVPPAGAGTKPKLGASVKLPNLSLRASLNRVRSLEPGDRTDSSKNLMDDQSVASFGITDSTKYGVLPDVELARSKAPRLADGSTKLLPPRRYSAHSTSMPSASHGDVTSQDVARRFRVKGKSTTENLNNSWSESAAGTTTEPIDMFDNFTQQRRSSTSNSGEPDPFESMDAFASNSVDVANQQPPALQRAMQIEEEPTMDESNPSEYSRRGSSVGDGRVKKSKMQKIGELLTERKTWSLEKRALRAKTISQAEKITRLEKEIRELGDSETRSEEINKLKRDLEKSQKEAKLGKRQLVSKKAELTSKDKELADNMTEISTLRKELSQALQQVDMLEEELENDKTRILTLTKGLLAASQGADDYSTDDVETRQEQQEMFDRELKKKDRKIESQRTEVNKQVEEMQRLKTELASSQLLVRKNEVLAEQIADLTETNKEISAELALKEQELADARKMLAAQNRVHASKLREIERKRQISAGELSSASRAIGRDNESAEALRQESRAIKAALTEAQQKIDTITTQHNESLAHLQDTIHRLEEEKTELESKLQQYDPKVQATINSLQSTNQELERTVLDLQKSVDRERKEFEKLESKLNTQISSLRSSLDASQNLHQQSENEAKMGVSGLQAKLSETELALEEMKLYNEELEASVEELKETSADFELDLSRLQDEHLELQAKAATLEEELGKANTTAEAVQARLAKVQEEAVALDEKNTKLEQRLAQVEDDNERLKANVEDVEGEAAEARQAVSALEDLMDEYDDLQDEAHTLRKKVSKLELELVEVKMESREWKASADRAENALSEARELLTQAEQARNDLELLNVESNELGHRYVEIQKQLEEGNTERDALRKEVRDANVQLEEYMSIVGQLEEEQLRLRSIEEEVGRLRYFKESSESQINELTSEKEKLIENAAEAKAAFAARQTEISDLRVSSSEYSSLRTEAAELTSALQARGTEIEVLRKERDDLNVAAELAEIELAKTRNALASLDDLVEDYEVLQAEADRLHQDKAKLESQLQTLHKEKYEVEETARVATAKADAAEAELKALKNQVETHDHDAKELAHANADLVVTVAELHSSIDVWKKKVAQAETNSTKATELGEKCVEYQERINAMEAVTGELREGHDKAILEMRKLEFENAKWKNAHEKATAELDEAKKSSQYLEERLQESSHLQEEMKTLRAEHSRLVSEMGEMDARDLQLRTLKDQLRSEIGALNAQRVDLKSRSRDTNEAFESNALIPSSKNVVRSVDIEREALQAENRKLAARVEEMDEERKILAEKNMEVQMELADRDSTRASLDEAKRARVSLQAELDALRERNAFTDQKIASITSERDHWRQLAETSENHAGEANDALIALEEQMEQKHRIKREQLHVEMKILQSQVDDLVAERSTLEDSLAKADESIANASRETATLRLSVSELQSCRVEREHMSAEMKILQSTIDDLIAERSTLQDSLANADENIANAARETATLRLSISELQSCRVEREQMSAAMKILQSQIDDLTAERNTLKDSLAKADGSIANAAHETSMLRSSLSELASLKDRISVLESENDDLAAKVEASIKESESLKASAALSESKSVGAHSELASLKKDREELMAAKVELVKTREQNSQILLQIAERQAGHAMLKTAASRAEAAEKELNDTRRTLLESEQQISQLERRYADLESQFEELLEERESLTSAYELTKIELKEVQASMTALKALELELDRLRDSNAETHAESAAMRSQNEALDKEMRAILVERDQLKVSLIHANEKSEQRSARLSVLEQSETILNDLRKQVDDVRHRLNVADDESIITAVRHLHQDYSDVLDENDRLRESLADLDGEIVALHTEREELLSQAEERAAGAFSVANQSTNAATGMQALCEELQLQLQAMTRDRDSWKETADTVARTGNKGERKRTLADNDEYSVSSARSVSTEQQMLLQQALEYREKRDGKKSAWSFSTFGVQRPTKVDTESTADSSCREELIDRLSDLNETYLETISKLKSDVVGLNTSLKEESYSMKKKLDALDQENQAYELKVMALEHALERLGNETKSSDGPEDHSRQESLQFELDQLRNEKAAGDRQIAMLKAELDKRASAPDIHHKQVEIDHLKAIQSDFQAKVDALESMMDAINQENETLRRIAEKASNFSLDSDLGRQIEQDDKDVKIALLTHELADLQLQGHQKLKNQVLQLQNEKREIQNAMEEHFQIMDEENRSHLEDLEARLEAREATIKQLESVLETVAQASEDASYDTSGDSTYFSSAHGRS